MWKNKQLIPEKWIEESFQSHVQRHQGGSYGYQFWLWQDTIRNKPTPIIACIGNGDQRIFFDKTHDLIVVITAGNYNKWDIEKDSYALMKDFIYPALIKQ